MKFLVERARRNKKVQLVAKVVSRVFDPIVVVPLTLGLAVWWALYNGERWRFLTLLIFLDAALPGFVLAWFIQKKRVLSGWDVKDRQERVPLFWFVVLAHLIGVLGAWFLGKHPLAEYLTTFWVLAVVYAALTMVWKVSVHVGVMSALVMFLVMTVGPHYAWLFALVLVVVWARVVGHYHRLSQAVVGGVIPVVVVPAMFWLLGIF